MRLKQTWLVWFAAAALLLIVSIAVWLRSTPGRDQHANVSPRSTPVSIPPPEVRTDAPAAIGTGPSYQAVPKGGAGKDPEALRNAAEGFNVPVNFFGKVIDQEGVPLSGVKVFYSIRHMTLGLSAFPQITSKFAETVTAADGGFRIVGEKGDSLSIDKLSKAGYQVGSREQRGFAYAHSPEVFTPDPQRPVVFTMVKAADVSQLKRFTGRFGVPYNATPVAVDPLTGRRSGNGELKISCLREPPAGPTPPRDYPWKLTVQLEGGGLMPVEPGAIYEAPAEGYQPQVDYEMKAGIAWKSSVRQEYYFKTAQNFYGRLSLDLSLRNDEPDAFVAISGMVNPTGSRVLEPATASVP